jgi:hypothetical protein
VGGEREEVTEEVIPMKGVASQSRKGEELECKVPVRKV